MICQEQNTSGGGGPMEGYSVALSADSNTLAAGAAKNVPVGNSRARIGDTK